MPTATLNQQAMLWRTSPAASELEEVALGWLRQMLGLPDSFEGVIYDGGSMHCTSTRHMTERLRSFRSMQAYWMARGVPTLSS